MNMKSHIIAALRESLDRWEALLGSLNEAQITAPLPASHWSIKNVIAHLMAWQLRSSARLEAALLDREPEFPKWPSAGDSDSEGNTDQINAWIYETYRDQPWPEVHRQWREGFQRFLGLAEQISERDLLDSERYSWFNDAPLAFVLLASYDHHQEHFEKLQSDLSSEN